MTSNIMYHCEQRQFKSKEVDNEIDDWVQKFAVHYQLPMSWTNNVQTIVKKAFEDIFINNTLSVTMELSTNPNQSVSIVETCTNSLEEQSHSKIIERQEFDRIIQENPYFARIKPGEMGRLQMYKTSFDDENIDCKIFVGDLERAPIVDLSRSMYRFRRSFALSLDYTLQANTKLLGGSPKEELILFGNRNLFNREILSAVTSLLCKFHIGTAFRVTPCGGFITCYHNLSWQDGEDFEEIFLHQSVVSKSLSFAASGAKEATIIKCDMPDLDDKTTDPLDETESAMVALKHSDIAFLECNECQGNFLIPCTNIDLLQNDGVACVGYPGEFNATMIKDAYRDIAEGLRPDLEEYREIFSPGNLSVSPGLLLGFNSSVLATEFSTVKGFSGSPVVLLKNPRMFVGIHYRGRKGKNYGLSVSCSDPGFYTLYINNVVPKLKVANLTQQERDAINRYITSGSSDLRV